MNRIVENRSYRKARSIGEGIGFLLFTVVLVLCIAFFISGTVQSKNAGEVTVDEQYYQVLEASYVEEIKECLDEQGYQNSGVTMTRTVEADGERVYEVVLHHKGLYKLTAQEQEALLQMLKGMSFDVVGCDFQISFLQRL